MRTRSELVESRPWSPPKCPFLREMPLGHPELGTADCHLHTKAMSSSSWHSQIFCRALAGRQGHTTDANQGDKKPFACLALSPSSLCGQSPSQKSWLCEPTRVEFLIPGPEVSLGRLQILITRVLESLKFGFVVITVSVTLGLVPVVPPNPYTAQCYSPTLISLHATGKFVLCVSLLYQQTQVQHSS